VLRSVSTKVASARSGDILCDGEMLVMRTIDEPTYSVSESGTALGAAADSVSYLYDLEAGSRRNLDVVSREGDRVAWAY
jgi:hypothetical protein